MSESNLASLPTELLYHILSYSTGCREEEEKTRVLNETVCAASKLVRKVPKLSITCPLYTIASTCRHLRDVVESFARHLLLQHHSVTGFHSLKTTSRKYVSNQTKVRTHRVAWVKWVLRDCAFCGKASTRRALMNDAFHCCQPCDKKEWPDKITMTNALKDFNLTKLDLFTPNPLFPSSRFPRLRFAIYDCVGVETTVFMKDEVAIRAKLIHGTDEPEQQKLRKRRRTRIENLTQMKVMSGRWTYLMKDEDYERWHTYNPHAAEAGFSSGGTDDRLHELIQKEHAKDNLT